MAKKKPSVAAMKAASKERLSGPLPISVIIDKDGNLKYGSQRDLDRLEQNQKALNALYAGDEKTYDRIMKELYG